MRALVTGGAGFLGSHLCERLLIEGMQVIALDNLQTGALENIETLKKYPGFTFKKHDVTKPYDIRADWIFNFACPASPRHYQEDPLKTLHTTLWGTEHACQNALKHNARLLQASTSEVYGDPLENPQNENYWGHVNPIGQRACYDEGKRAAETICTEYYNQKGLDMRLIRIFNTYGPRMAADDGRVVSNFVVQALRGEPLTVYGKGDQTRSFCYVDDLVDGIWRMMRLDNYANDFTSTSSPLASEPLHIRKGDCVEKSFSADQECDSPISENSISKSKSISSLEIQNNNSHENEFSKHTKKGLGVIHSQEKIVEIFPQVSFFNRKKRQAMGNWIGPVNLGNPGEFTILELAEKILKLTGSESKIVFKQLPSDDPRQRKPDINKAQKLLGGWSPKISLEDGLKETIDWFRTVID